MLVASNRSVSRLVGHLCYCSFTGVLGGLPYWQQVPSYTCNASVQVTAYVTAAHMKFLLLHDGKNDDAVKLFFRDVYEIYLKVSSHMLLAVAGCHSRQISSGLQLPMHSMVDCWLVARSLICIHDFLQ
jgi:Sedlin, N-terminal conserved region